MSAECKPLIQARATASLERAVSFPLTRNSTYGSITNHGSNTTNDSSLLRSYPSLRHQQHKGEHKVNGAMQQGKNVLLDLAHLFISLIS